MKTTKISFGLSEKEIDRALKELEAYKRDLIRKTELLRERIAAQIANEAQSGFNGALVDDLLKGGKRYAEVDVTVTDKDNISVVIANGEDAVWAEFGSGVFHNGAAGSSPHPKGQELGFTIGGYGKGMGKREIWGFYEDGELRLTHGAPATMPMYRAVQSVIDNLPELARQIFST